MKSEPLLPEQNVFALDTKQSAEMDAACEAMSALFQTSGVVQESAEVLTQGMTAIRDLMASAREPSEPQSTQWAGMLQRLPGGARLLMIEAPDGLRGVTLRMTSDGTPYAGEAELGGLTPGHCEFVVKNDQGTACLSLWTESDKREVALPRLGEWRWTSAPSVIGVMAPSAATFTSLIHQTTIKEPAPSHDETVSAEPPVQLPSSTQPPPSAPPPLPSVGEVTVCQHCGRPMSATARFCGSCGKPRGAKLCAKCGQPITHAAAKFCGACGNPIA